MMEIERAIQLVKTLQVTVASDSHGLAMGRKAATQRLDRAAKKVLDGLIGRKPTTEEIKESTRW